MTLRLPEEIDAQARAAAEEDHRSLHSFIVNAVAEKLQRRSIDRAVEQAAQEGAQRYADALDRLGKV